MLRRTGYGVDGGTNPWSACRVMARPPRIELVELGMASVVTVSSRSARIEPSCFPRAMRLRRVSS